MRRLRAPVRRRTIVRRREMPQSHVHDRRRLRRQWGVFRGLVCRVRMPKQRRVHGRGRRGWHTGRPQLRWRGVPSHVVSARRKALSRARQGAVQLELGLRRRQDLLRRRLRGWQVPVESRLPAQRVLRRVVLPDRVRSASAVPERTQLRRDRVREDRRDLDGVICRRGVTTRSPGTARESSFRPTPERTPPP